MSAPGGGQIFSMGEKKVRDVCVEGVSDFFVQDIYLSGRFISILRGGLCRLLCSVQSCV